MPDYLRYLCPLKTLVPEYAIPNKKEPRDIICKSHLGRITKLALPTLNRACTSPKSIVFIRGLPEVLSLYPGNGNSITTPLPLNIRTKMRRQRSARGPSRHVIAPADGSKLEYHYVRKELEGKAITRYSAPLVKSCHDIKSASALI